MSAADSNGNAITNRNDNKKANKAAIVGQIRLEIQFSFSSLLILLIINYV